jgi:hypothetical protein
LVCREDAFSTLFQLRAVQIRIVVLSAAVPLAVAHADENPAFSQWPRKLTPRVGFSWNGGRRPSANCRRIALSRQRRIGSVSDWNSFRQSSAVALAIRAFGIERSCHAASRVSASSLLGTAANVSLGPICYGKDTFFTFTVDFVNQLFMTLRMQGYLIAKL